MRRAIFFDRDGVINHLVPRPDGRKTCPWSLAEFMFLPRVREAFARVTPHYECFVVTNQPHVGHEMTEEELDRIHRYLRHEIAGIVDIAYCTVQGSSHYKPNHGMVLDLLHRYPLSAIRHQHYMIGDRWKDIVCGYHAGLTTIFVGDKYEHGGWDSISPNYMVPDIYAACELIMERTLCETKN
jgi:D-glycero-D-manno-heptose 1,7-bisphosphate phosphatase